MEPVKQPKLKPLWVSGSQDWRTPDKVYKLLNEEFNFNFDPAPNNPTFDGLSIEWKERNYINPPYKDVARWIHKGCYEALNHNELCVFLIAARTDTKWFHEIVLPYAKEIRFIKGRLHFNESKNSAPFPSMIVIFDGRKT